MASVALRHGISANLVRKWIPLYRDCEAATLPTFVPIKRPSTPQVDLQMSVSIDVLFGDQNLTVKWPLADPDGCTRFIRGLTQ